MANSDNEYISGANFETLLGLEQKAIEYRRVRSGGNDWYGVALSGGGIRSAIFCLGALQALAEHNVLAKFDYMSSVSGGGYTASALHWLWHQNANTGTSKSDFPFGNPHSPRQFRGSTACRLSAYAREVSYA